MTGIYKIIDSIRNADTLTFLERAPRTELEPLDIARIADRYMEGNIKKTRQYLSEFAYRKIWSEISKKDREVIVASAMVPTGEICEIREILDWSANQFNPYRNRLIKAGIISGRQYGVVTFSLPGFDKFALQTEDSYC